jgi:apolipoprotein N-acyltransferase
MHSFIEDLHKTKRFWPLLAILSAVLLNLCFPYPGISILAWVSMVPLFIVVMTQSLKRAVLAGLITGILFNTVYLFWVREYKHPASLPGVVACEVGYLLFAVILSWFLYRNVKFIKELALPLSWLSIDYLKTVGYLAFPWGIPGYSQYGNLALIQTASIFGVWGITFLIYYFNAVMASIIVSMAGHKKQRRNLINVAVLSSLLIATLAFGIVKLSENTRGEYKFKRVALVQPNFDPWSPDLDGNLRSEILLTRKALNRNPDLIVWSESSVPFPYDFYLARNYNYARMVHDFFASIRKPILFGSIEFDGEYKNRELRGDFYNVAIFYDNGKEEAVYKKIHLVPFGEWFPYKRLFPWVARILDRAGAGDFKPGEKLVVFESNGLRFNALICYEDVFGNLARKFILEGSRLLVNVTNDAWTHSQRFQIQHFSISIFRTIENRVSLIRAANGGVTACIDPYGRVLGSLDMFAADLLVCDVPVPDFERLTFYTACGDVLPWTVLAFVVGMILYIPSKKVIDRIRNKNNM